MKRILLATAVAGLLGAPAIAQTPARPAAPAGAARPAAPAAPTAAARPAVNPAVAAYLNTPPKPPGPPTALKPGKRVNRAIELWKAGQPVYYIGADGGYEEGKKLAGTKADMIMYGMEHAPLDFTKLREFMMGLKDAGPTRSGHVTPAVVVTLPIPGTADALRANGWMIQQALAQGIHGILLCNAESPEAVQLMVQAARYPFDPPVVGIPTGTRGNGSQGQAAPLWGMSADDYFKSADVWPLNPNGEIILGVKIENPRSDAQLAAIFNVPGVSFAEHGPGDHGFNIMGPPGSGDNANDPRMIAIRENVFAEARKHDIKFLSGCNENNVEALIKEGVMLCTGGDTPAADKGRAFTKRTLPW